MSRIAAPTGRSLSILAAAQPEVLRAIQELMPYGVAVREVLEGSIERPSKLVS
jgi:hypothetical protein